jgi:lipid-binding SYLF domain-containing protein
MTMRHALPLLALLVGVASVGTRAQPADSEEAARIREAVVVLDEIMKATDSAIPESILDKAAGIAVFPGTIRAGFIVGGMLGRGILSARSDGAGWSSPTFMTITGGSFGLQIGGQATDIILVIQNQRGLENLIRNQFKFEADAAAAAGPVGREAELATDLQLRAEILSYSRARGLFAGVTLGGSTVRIDVDANERFYGARLDGPQVVLQGEAATPAPVPDWLAALGRYASP